MTSAALVAEPAALPRPRRPRGTAVRARAVPARAGRALHWFTVLGLVHSTQAVLAVVTGPTGLLDLGLWALLWGVSAAGLVDDLLRRRERLPVPGWLPAFVAVALVSAVVSSALVPSLSATLRLTGTVLFCLFVASRSAPRQLVDAVVDAAAVIAVLSLGLLLAGDPRAIDDLHGTLRGVLVAKNSLGAVMSVGVLAAALALRLEPARWPRTALRVVPVAAALLLSGSAGGLVVTTLGLLTLFAVQLRALLARVLPPALLLLAGVAVLVVAQTELDPAWLVSLIGRDLTLTGRTDIWAAALSAVADRPLLGHGYGAFWEHTAAAEAVRQEIGFRAAHGHNGPLDVALGTGLVGLAVALGVLAHLVRRGRRLCRGGGPEADSGRLMLAVVWLAVVSTMVETGLLSPNGLLTLLLGLASVGPAVRRPGDGRRRPVALRGAAGGRP